MLWSVKEDGRWETRKILIAKLHKPLKYPSQRCGHMAVSFSRWGGGPIVPTIELSRVKFVMWGAGWASCTLKLIVLPIVTYNYVHHRTEKNINFNKVLWRIRSKHEQSFVASRETLMQEQHMDIQLDEIEMMPYWSRGEGRSPCV